MTSVSVLSTRQTFQHNVQTEFPLMSAIYSSQVVSQMTGVYDWRYDKSGGGRLRFAGAGLTAYASANVFAGKLCIS